LRVQISSFAASPCTKGYGRNQARKQDGIHGKKPLLDRHSRMGVDAFYRGPDFKSSVTRGGGLQLCARLPWSRTNPFVFPLCQVGVLMPYALWFKNSPGSDVANTYLGTQQELKFR